MKTKLSAHREAPSPDRTMERNPRFSKNFVLKACIFATGLSGIVAEYVISTLASYLLGNTVLQWTLIVSLMLFAMGVGSRFSRYFRSHLLDVFVFIEFGLSLLVAGSALLAYYLAPYLASVALIIYPTAFAIGVFIGLEIPLATRLNDLFEELRINISTVMEKDYYGALLGGVLFAFVALPYLGLTYTPIILGTVNFLVASVLFWQFRSILNFKKILTTGMMVVPAGLVVLTVTAEPIILFGEQQKYNDKVVFQKQTPYQRIVITQWKDYYWLYLNGNEQFSSFDEERYHEPLVHPAMQVAAARRSVLILGGGDGLAAREILKYPEVQKITLVDIDPAMTKLGQTHPLFQKLNRNSLNDARVEIVNRDAAIFMEELQDFYDVIVVDLPDPKSVDIARMYTKQFYAIARRHLSRGGALVTQATSPFFSRAAFLSILNTMRSAGFNAVPYHNQVPTLGEWGWVLGINSASKEPGLLRERLEHLNFDTHSTRFLNNEAMRAMLSFGKDVLKDIDLVDINDERDLKLFRYYQNGLWDLY